MTCPLCGAETEHASEMDACPECGWDSRGGAACIVQLRTGEVFWSDGRLRPDGARYRNLREQVLDA